MRKIIFVPCFCFLSLLSIYATPPSPDSIPTLVFHDSLESWPKLPAYLTFLEDQADELDIDRIMQDSSLKFVPVDSITPGIITRSIWIRLRLKNRGTKKVSGMISSSNLIDTLWSYQVQNEVIIEKQMSSVNENIYSKLVPSHRNYISLSLGPSDSMIMYINCQFRNNATTAHLSHCGIFPTRNFISYLFRTSATQFTYAGMMSILVLISIFLFITFRERSFIFFGLLAFCFILYFLEISSILRNYTPVSLHSGVPFAQMIISGIVLFVGLFVRDFLDLKQHLPRYNTAYLAITIFVALICHILLMTTIPVYLTVTIHNGVLLVFVFCTMVPMVILTRRKIKSGRILLYSFLVLFIGSVFFQLSLLGILPGGVWAKNTFQFGSLAFSSFLFYGIFDKITGIQNEQIRIKAERDKTDELLLNILPFDVVRELKEKGYSDARDYERASILFTDFKEFTQASALLTAKELVKEIDACFKAFDNICEKYSIEKIKTIGDAYMAAGGLSDREKDSANQTTKAALEMQTFLVKRREEHLRLGKVAFQMRIGIHTGPVVAGIVGLKKFQYDVWGDTVNTAARIESAGEEDKVNISHSTYRLIQDEPHFTFEPRGMVNVKGKGDVRMYFVHLHADA